MKSYEGYLKLKFGDDYLLLAGGGKSAITDFKAAESNWLSITNVLDTDLTTYLDSTANLHNYGDDELNLFRFVSQTPITYGLPCEDSISMVFSADDNISNIRVLTLNKFTNDIYLKNKYQGTWGNWATLVTSDNIASSIGSASIPLETLGNNTVVISGESLKHPDYYATGPDFRTALELTRSYVGSDYCSFWGWQNVISCRHRNGWSDGYAYGMYIRSSLTDVASNLVWDREVNQSWQGERTILDSVNWSSIITDQSFRWPKQYTFNLASGETRWLGVGNIYAIVHLGVGTFGTGKCYFTDHTEARSLGGYNNTYGVEVIKQNGGDIGVYNGYGASVNVGVVVFGSCYG